MHVIPGLRRHPQNWKVLGKSRSSSHFVQPVVITVFEKPFNGTVYNPDGSSPRHAILFLEDISNSILPSAPKSSYCSTRSSSPDTVFLSLSPSSVLKLAINTLFIRYFPNLCSLTSSNLDTIRHFVEAEWKGTAKRNPLFWDNIIHVEND